MFDRMEPSKKPEKQGKKKSKRLLLWALVALSTLALAAAIAVPLALREPEPQEISYTEFCALVEQKQVEKITYTLGQPKFAFQKPGSDTVYETDNPNTEGFKEKMLLAGVEFEELTPSTFWAQFFQIIMSYLPIMILIPFFVIMVRSMTGRGFSAEAAERPDTTFDDVAGLDEIKEDMKVIAETIKDPSLCEKIGAHITRGVLLEGSPGNGKTLFASV